MKTRTIYVTACALSALAITMLLQPVFAQRPKNANRTTDDLKVAYLGETTAHAKYESYAGEAETEGFSAEAQLFRAAAAAENFHAHNHKAVLASLGVKTPTPGFYNKRPGTTHWNLTEALGASLKDAIRGESYERDEMYPQMIKNALAEKQPDAVRAERYALAAETQHAALFAQALKNLGHNRKVPFYAVSTVSGCTWVGTGPKVDPISNQSREKFLQVK